MATASGRDFFEQTASIATGSVSKKDAIRTVNVDLTDCDVPSDLAIGYDIFQGKRADAQLPQIDVPFDAKICELRLAFGDRLQESCCRDCIHSLKVKLQPEYEHVKYADHKANKESGREAPAFDPTFSDRSRRPCGGSRS